MASELFFLIRNAGALERIQRVEVSEATIGRTATNVLCLPDPAVSRNHAVLSWTPTECLIRDLGSRNGTLLNGRPIEQAVLPAAGLVEIGPYQLKGFRDQGSAQAEVEGVVGATRIQSVPARSSYDRERCEQQLTPAQHRCLQRVVGWTLRKGDRSRLEDQHQYRAFTHARDLHEVRGLLACRTARDVRGASHAAWMKRSGHALTPANSRWADWPRGSTAKRC
jgi:hypothetical protein